MAKITLSFDTKTKLLSVTKDGQTLENVISAHFYNYYDEDKFYAQITMQKIEEDMTNTHMINAEEMKDKDKKKKKKEEKDKNKKESKWGY